MDNTTETTDEEDNNFILALRRAGFGSAHQRAVTANPAVARRWVARFDPRTPKLTPEEAKTISIDKLFTARASSTARTLKQSGIHTLGDLASCTRREVFAVPSVGKVRLDQIERRLAEYGLAFADAH